MAGFQRPLTGRFAENERTLIQIRGATINSAVDMRLPRNRSGRCDRRAQDSASERRDRDAPAYPQRGGQTKVVAFIESPQDGVIENILRHCRLWCPSSPRAPPTEHGWVHDPDADADRQPTPSDEFREVTLVDIDTFELTLKF